MHDPAYALTAAEALTGAGERAIMARNTTK